MRPINKLRKTNTDEKYTSCTGLRLSIEKIAVLSNKPSQRSTYLFSGLPKEKKKVILRAIFALSMEAKIKHV